MALVQQVRVIRNVVWVGALCLLTLALMRARLWEHGEALGLGGVAGGLYGWRRWGQLRDKISRRDRRYERNKIFVQYLSLVEIAISAVAYNCFLAIPLGLLLLAGVLLTHPSYSWWTTLGGSFGLSGAGVLACRIFRYEQHNGPLYYQYNTEGWSGAEGMLYQVGTVVQPLMPAGKVKIQGVLWNAVSLSGEAVTVGQQVEVISMHRLTLYVDRLPTSSDPRVSPESLPT
ncbi:MAG TPA: NfeD family protein [Candidatus Tectomicrobia bacterium]|jgi:membrane protein implicated in regulation of membrane protease activity